MINKIRPEDGLEDSGLQSNQLISSRTVRTHPESYFLKDSEKVIDFVLTYDEQAGGASREEWAQYRSQYESELAHRGLEMEKVEGQDGKTTFVKIHATWDSLARQAELEDLQMPIIKSDLGTYRPFSYRLMNWVFKDKNPCLIEEEYRQDESEYFTDAFDRDRMESFIIEDKTTFFSQAQRVYLTWGILNNVQVTLTQKQKKGGGLFKRKKKDAKKTEDNSPTEPPDAESIEEGFISRLIVYSKCIRMWIAGIEKTLNIQLFLNMGIYSSGFPLHDGDCTDKETNKDYSDVPVHKWPLRRYLYHSWGMFRQWKKYQPLDLIRDYYGEKVGIYFAWLGFYTKMLFIPALLGLLSIIFGTIRAFGNMPLIQEVCNTTSPLSNWTICRSCPSTVCHYTDLGSLCLMLRINRIFDNGTGAGFAIFMVLWAVLFQEFWLRTLADICCRWDVTDAEFTSEQVRPEYEVEVKTTRVNPISKQLEPYLPTMTRFNRLLASLTTVFIFMGLVISLVATVMIYKIASPSFWAGVIKDTFLDIPLLNPRMISSLTAACMNGLFIAVMNQIYQKVAWYLTVSELPRTMKQFEESYVYKVTGFQFVNYYGAIFYLSFIRGQFMPAPNQQGLFRDRCEPSGCMLDVTIMLFVVMTGKQAFNNFVELGVPWIMKKVRSRLGGYTDLEEEAQKDLPRWEKDFLLQPIEPVPLFSDYLEMSIQFGFITMFVGAFPLAPLFALINNVLEIRVDGFKYLQEFQRFIPVRANNIGPWGDIIKLVTKVAILTNAWMVAFTTDFIDKFVYMTFYEGDPDYPTYVQFRLSRYETKDWCGGSKNCDDLMGGHESCWFRDYRQRQDDGDYARTNVWWVVMVAKLSFVLIFEHSVIFAQNLIRYIIPDVPDHVTLKQKRETFLQKQIFMKHEMEEQDRKERELRDQAAENVDETSDGDRKKSARKRQKDNKKDKGQRSPRDGAPEE